MQHLVDARFGVEAFQYDIGHQQALAALHARDELLERLAAPPAD